ncbi:MAG: DUF58 domain-containing protein [Lachnospiraceae bacterium]|nr:DUF58 domain-containing protein [Lachnospiraceae bacterium]
MKLDVSFFDTLSRLRLSMGHKSSMNLSGNRKSVLKGSSTEFSDFREYMPGDDIRRIDWNAYGRLDRFYVKEYMEEKEAVISILLDTSASMDYGKNKKSDMAAMLTAAMAYLGLNNMDRVLIYDVQKMDAPFVAYGGKRAFPRLADWLGQRTFSDRADIAEAIRRLPVKGPGITILISDFLQEEFVDTDSERFHQLLRFLDYRRQKAVFLHVLAEEELNVELTGTRNLIDMEEKSTLRLTLDASSIRIYEKALQAFTASLKRDCAKAGAIYALCSTGRDFHKLIFEDLRMLYDI